MTLTIRPLAMHEWNAALETLHASLDNSVRRQTIIDDLDRLKKSPSLADGLLGAFHNNRLDGFLWAEALPDNVVQFRGPYFCEDEKLSFSERSEVGSQLLSELEQQATQQKRTAIQTLIEPLDGTLQQLLAANDFTCVAKLSYQLCLLTALPLESLTAQFSVYRYDESLESELAKVVEQTFVDSRDCPALEGRRSLTSTLAGYRAVGDSDTRNWWFAEWKGQKIGCVLLAAHHESGSLLSANQPDAIQSSWCELVYWGVVPAVRGRGFGRELVLFALRQAAALRADKLILAVDAANEPAIRIYRELGFVEWLQRAIWAKNLS